MTIALFIKNRLKELKLGQKDLARAANVTDSYISQLMAHKKLPPAPNGTDMYDKISRVLKLPDGQLAKLADLQRREHLQETIRRPAWCLDARRARADPSQMQYRQER